MILHPFAEASRNWSGALNRLAFGALTISILTTVGPIPSEFGLQALAQAESFREATPAAILLTIMSMLTGMLAIHLGSFGPSGRFGITARMRRALRVGRTGNVLLLEALRDANSKYEIAAGFFGALIVGAIGVIFAFFSGPENDSAVAANDGLSINSPFLSATAGALGGLTGGLIRRSAMASIIALDEVLDEIDAATGPAQ